MMGVEVQMVGEGEGEKFGLRSSREVREEGERGQDGVTRREGLDGKSRRWSEACRRWRWSWRWR